MLQVLPKVFAEKFGSNLANPITLLGEDKYKWKVKLSWENGKIWFSEGWQEFVRKYNLKRYDFVFFKYDGSHKMEVVILRDRSQLVRRARRRAFEMIDLDVNEETLWTTKLSAAAARKGAALVSGCHWYILC